ncbi:MAG: NAD-dependent epimerase/dehydratase family protein [Oligoflexia bacterium]|nr:NAD-dependent epimerase/dehydratase family protein [Oligoflexia bacterium]
MKILVTGGNGFLGSWIVRALVNKGHVVRVLHRKSSVMNSLKNISYESALGDVTEYSTVLEAACGMDAIFHAAAVIAYSPLERTLMERVNVYGTENVVRAAIDAKVQKFVHTSSVVAVGATLEPRLLHEESPYEMSQYNFGYYETKFHAEELIRSAVRSGKLDAVIVNPSIMFGPGDAVKGSRKTHLKVASGLIPFYPTGGINIADVEDVVEGHILALKKGRAGERYILGGDNILVKDLFDLLAQFGGHRAPMIPLSSIILRSLARVTELAERYSYKINIPVESAIASTMYHWYDLSKARKELGYNPKPAYGAVKKSVQWCFENGYLTPGPRLKI